ncbi:MAG: hypothetical protein WBW71_03360 [Bacteroidota bacterium]
MSEAIRTVAGSLKRFVPLVVFILSFFLSISCSSTHETTAIHPAPQHRYHAEKLFVPAGWSIESDSAKSLLPGIFLTKNDGDAAMILKELKPVDSTKGMLAGEDICVLGNISMQTKLGTDDSERRVLRLPSAAGEGNEFCVYVYSENSLLRRVAVFRTKSKIYELELRQNSESLLFSSAVDAQTAFAKSLMKEE